jgi:hypothetical protein
VTIIRWLMPPATKHSPFLVLALVTRVAHAAFTQQTCGWGQLCVDSKQEGGRIGINDPLWCFYPSPDTSATVTGCGILPASDWQSVMLKHLNSTHAIAYYDLDLTYLGDGSMPVSKLVYFCASGLAEGLPRTLCSSVSRDDDLSDSGSGCYTNAVSTQITDGCYALAGESEVKFLKLNSQLITLVDVSTTSSPAATQGGETSSQPASSTVAESTPNSVSSRQPTILCTDLQMS